MQNRMEFRIALHDALSSVCVPPEKAKAVVQALEREMFEQLATKQDLQLQLQATKQELTLQLTLRLGAMMVAGFTIMLALLKLML